MGGIIFGIIVYLIINFIGAACMQTAAEHKGYDESAHVLGLCFWLGPIGYMYAICLPDRKLQYKNEQILEALERIEKQNGIKAETSKREVKEELPDL